MKTFLRQLFLLLGVFSFTFLHASDIKTGGEVKVTEPVKGNLYLAGGQVEIAAPVTGDLLVAGGEIRVLDSLRADALIAGGQIFLEGWMGEDLRVFGGEIHINKDVHGDLFVAGGQVEIAEGVTISGDLICMAGEVDVFGKVLGNVYLKGGELDLWGDVAGNLEVQGGEFELSGTVAGTSTIAVNRIKLNERARFEDDVRYWQKDAAYTEFGDHLAEGKTARYDETLKGAFSDVNWEKGFAGGIVALTLFRIFSGLVLVLILIGFFGDFFARRAGKVREKAGYSLLYGFLTFIGLPILTVVAMATVIGIPVGLVSGAAWIILLLITNAVTAVVLAYEYRKYRNKEWSKGMLFLVAALTFIGLRLVGLIPGIGSLLTGVVAMIAIGYLLMTLLNKDEGGTQPKSKEQPTEFV